MGIFLKGNWCCFQVLGDLDPFLVKFFEVERGRPRFRCHQDTRNKWNTSGFSVNIPKIISMSKGSDTFEKTIIKFHPLNSIWPIYFLGHQRDFFVLGHSTWCHPGPIPPHVIWLDSLATSFDSSPPTSKPKGRAASRQLGFLVVVVSHFWTGHLLFFFGGGCLKTRWLKAGYWTASDKAIDLINLGF